jgi:cephalosporin-C deacetylase-like acetyl esterase
MLLPTTKAPNRHATRFILITVLTALCLFSPISSALDIAEGWRIHQGDDPAWAQPEFNDAAWQSIEVGQPWEETIFPDYNGYAWYRLSIVVPEELNKGEYIQHYKKLNIALGAIDDVDTTYFNGVQIGQTGSPDKTQGFWQKQRNYDVPLDLVRWGESNVIAVRVFDNDGDGGMHAGPYALVAPAWNQYMAIEMGLGRGDGIYVDSKSAKLSAEIRNDSFENMKGAISWRIENETWREDQRGDPLAQKSKARKIGTDQSITTSYRFRPPAPGFYHVTCTFTREGQEESVSQSMMMGFSPEKAVRPTDAPENLKPFWDETKAELAAVAPEFKVTPSPGHSTPDIDCYLVEMRSLGNVRIRGWYEVPKAPGPHPALLRVPGYTGNMQPARYFNDMIVLSLNIRGHGNSQDDVPGGWPDFILRGIGDPKTYFYRGAYMDCLRGLDFLASRPEVDSKRLGVTGGSQGGMLSLATAALDQRVMLSAPDIPFVMDSYRGFAITPWPGSVIRDWIDHDPQNNTWEHASELGRFFDPKNLAPWIQCPVFMGIGLQDPVCPAPTNFAAYNQITTEKQYRVYPFAGHGVPQRHNIEKIAWIRKQFASRQ